MDEWLHGCHSPLDVEQQLLESVPPATWAAYTTGDAQQANEAALRMQQHWRAAYEFKSWGWSLPHTKSSMVEDDVCVFAYGIGFHHLNDTHECSVMVAVSAVLPIAALKVQKFATSTFVHDGCWPHELPEGLADTLELVCRELKARKIQIVDWCDKLWLHRVQAYTLSRAIHQRAPTLAEVLLRGCYYPHAISLKHLWMRPQPWPDTDEIHTLAQHVWRTFLRPWAE